jgi:biopolymer transport protein ExbB
LNTLGQVYHGGAVVPVLLGMLLMVLVFSIEDFLLFQSNDKRLKQATA